MESDTAEKLKAKFDQMRKMHELLQIIRIKMQINLDFKRDANEDEQKSIINLINEVL